MKRNKIMAIAAVLFIMFSVINISAYAAANEPKTTATPEPVAAGPLTPKGNLTLVDDVKMGENNEVEEKQFITVETKDGNTFYIIIDRVGDKENVYFLNKVDEADLMTLIEENGAAVPGGGISTVPTPKPETEPTPEPSPQTEQPKEQGGGGGILVIVLLLAAAGGGGYYYFKILKPKQAKTAGGTGVDEFIFDDEETITEDEPPDTEPDDDE